MENRSKKHSNGQDKMLFHAEERCDKLLSGISKQTSQKLISVFAICCCNL